MAARRYIPPFLFFSFFALLHCWLTGYHLVLPLPTTDDDWRRCHATRPPVRASLPPIPRAERRASTPAPTWLTMQGCLCCYMSSSRWFCHVEVNLSSLDLFLVLIHVLSVV
jgi:hypothetical protein